MANEPLIEPVAPTEPAEPGRPAAPAFQAAKLPPLGPAAQHPSEAPVARITPLTPITQATPPAPVTPVAQGPAAPAAPLIAVVPHDPALSPARVTPLAQAAPAAPAPLTPQNAYPRPGMEGDPYRPTAQGTGSGAPVPPQGYAASGAPVPPQGYAGNGAPVPPQGYAASGAPVPPQGYAASGAPMPPQGYAASGAPVPPQGSAPAVAEPQQPEAQAPSPAPSLTNEQVTGHTASLWKYLPIPEDEPDRMPEYLSQSYALPGSRVLAARVRGKKHKHEGTNCDDWYEVANLGDITIIAVSDGAGSKKFSRVGARESCKAAVGYLVQTFRRTLAEKPDLRGTLSLEPNNPKFMEACSLLAGIVQQSVLRAFDAVETAYYSRLTDAAYARVLNRDLQFKDLSGTLLISVLVPVQPATHEHLVISCQIGDGMIALINTKGPMENSLRLMGVADSGDFSGETDFLTSEQTKAREKLQNRTKITRCVSDRLLVMTDGVADDYYPNDPEMRRLYFDLVLNGILDSGAGSLNHAALSAEQARLFKKIPDPVTYPWVNDQSVQVTLQYTSRICAALNLTLADLWKDPTVLELARLELEEMGKVPDRSDRLRVWLDNYVERGSFDDRTLVVVQM
ncbi:MAG: hypothetical protein GX418_07945 [Clostridiales bacterium]|nr:hypothetical protein [Clostridiales bacterium]